MGPHELHELVDCIYPSFRFEWYSQLQHVFLSLLTRFLLMDTAAATPAATQERYPTQDTLDSLDTFLSLLPKGDITEAPLTVLPVLFEEDQMNTMTEEETHNSLTRPAQPEQAKDPPTEGIQQRIQQDSSAQLAQPGYPTVFTLLPEPGIDMPEFDGKDATAFIRRIEGICKRHGVTGQFLEILPEYCRINSDYCYIKSHLGLSL